MTQQKTEVFYSYRYRSWDSNVYYGHGSREFSDVQIQSGWGEWEWIDERKYNEILQYISGTHPSHYQAQRIQCEIQEDDAFDPRRWIAKNFAAQDRERKHRNGKESETIYLAKCTLPDGSLSPWILTSSKVYENGTQRTHRNWPDPDGFSHHVTAREHMGTVFAFMINGVEQQAFEYHPDYSDMEPET